MKLADYAKLIDGKTCRWHIEPVKLPTKIDTYDHEYGWWVEEFDTRQWLSVQCPECKYDWSLWKLGVPREGG